MRYDAQFFENTFTLEQRIQYRPRPKKISGKNIHSHLVKPQVLHVWYIWYIGCIYISICGMLAALFLEALFKMLHITLTYENEYIKAHVSRAEIYCMFLGEMKYWLCREKN